MAAAVPEALKKKRVQYQAALAKRALAQQNAKKAGVLKRRAIIKRAAAYAKEYAQAENTLIQRKRQAKKNGNAYVDSEPKLAFVIRIRGINQVSPRVKKILQLLRLRQIGNATFVKLNKATNMMLNIAQWTGFRDNDSLRMIVGFDCDRHLKNFHNWLRSGIESWSDECLIDILCVCLGHDDLASLLRLSLIVTEYV